MKKRIPGSIFIPVVVFCSLVVLTSGCDRHARYRLLTVVFTGVPPLEETTAVEVEAPVAAGSPGNTKADGMAGEQLQIKLFSHTPYADGRCDICHQTQTNFGIPGQQKRETQHVFRRGGGKPGELVLPVKELCGGCHVQLSTPFAVEEELFLHTPAAEGKCHTCHDFHQSPNPYLLLEEPGEKCAKCHANDSEPAVKICAHAGACLDCHNPHLGRDRFLLIKDYREELLSVGADKYKTGTE